MKKLEPFWYGPTTLANNTLEETIWMQNNESMKILLQNKKEADLFFHQPQSELNCVGHMAHKI